MNENFQLVLWLVSNFTPNMWVKMFKSVIINNVWHMSKICQKKHIPLTSICIDRFSRHHRFAANFIELFCSGIVWLGACALFKSSLAILSILNTVEMPVLLSFNHRLSIFLKFRYLSVSKAPNAHIHTPLSPDTLSDELSKMKKVQDEIHKLIVSC